MADLKNRKFAASRREAKKIFEAKTGAKYNCTERHHSGNRIYTLKKGRGRSKTRSHFIGSYMEYINR